MIRLVPEWAYHYEEFWTAIKRRNLWFIQLRYFFVVLFVTFYLTGELILKFNLSNVQEYAFISIASSILFYNIILNKLMKNINSVPGKFNHMHLSLIQMLLDLSALMILVYFTGIIESPIYMFFIFQMVIGSLILPGYIVYFIGIMIVIIFSVLIFLQQFGMVPTHLIQGLYSSESAHTLTYVLIFISLFAGTLLISVLLANTIAMRLYQRERQLWETLAKLNEAEKAKQKYIIGVVHEIKTPIAAVQSMLDVVLNKYMGPVSDAVMEKLTRAKVRTIEAVTLINNVLHISKIKLLNITHQDDLIVSDIITDIIEKLIDFANSKKVELYFEDQRREQKYIKGDQVLFELAFSNLIGNAIKYNIANGLVKIMIRGDEERISIEISDNGIGIPEPDIKRIFDQFFRASNIKGQQIDGSGLGLSLVNEVINRYNGSVEVSSPSTFGTKERPGTTFNVTLPYAPGSSAVNREKERKTVRIHDRI